MDGRADGRVEFNARVRGQITCSSSFPLLLTSSQLERDEEDEEEEVSEEQKLPLMWRVRRLPRPRSELAKRMIQVADRYACKKTYIFTSCVKCQLMRPNTKYRQE